MERLLERNLYRHFRIIYFLLHHHWITIGELSNELAIPARTVRQSIGEINEYIQPAKIESSYQRGIHLAYGVELNPLYIYSAIYKQSENFLILEEVFLHDYPCLSALADKLFISESTLKRKIAVINQITLLYGFEIDPRKMDIIGNEKKIYFFYYSYLIEKYGVLESLLSKTELSIINELITEFFGAFRQLKDAKREVYAYFNKIRAMLFISLHRIQRGHLLKPHDQSMDPIPFSPSLAVREKIAAYYKINCSKSVLYHLFYCFFNPRYAWSAAELAEKSRKDPAIDKIRSALFECLSAIEQAEGLFIPHKERVLLDLYNATSYVSGPTKILYDPEEEFLVNLNQYYQKFMLRTKQKLVYYLTRSPLEIYLDDSVIDSFLFMLITSWDHLQKQLEKKAPRVKAAIFLNSSLEHNRFVLDDLAYHLRSRLDMHLVSAGTIKELSNVCTEFDLLITNLSAFELPNCPIVSIHSNPTIEDFDKIISVYDMIVDRKVAEKVPPQKDIESYYIYSNYN